MKGLFIKDIMLMKLQWRFFAVVTALALIMGFSMQDGVFALGYIAFVLPMFSLSTISYDDFDNGNAFLFTLPVTRREYIIEKYLFSLSLCFVSLFIGTLFFILIEGSASGTLSSAPFIFSIAALLLSLMLPLQLKFGAEKARIAVIIIGGGLFLIGFLLSKLASFADFNLDALFLWVENLDFAWLCICLLAASLSSLLISLKISIGIMNKKEF